MANRRGFQRAAQRRPTFWEGALFSSLPSVAGAVAEVDTLVTEANLENVPNSTVVRVRGSYGWSVAGANGSGVCALGIMLVNAPALAVGIGSLPTPITDIGSDWLWWDSFGWDNVGTAGDGPVLAGQRTIDSKAMRKTALNQVLVLITEIQGIGASAGIATINGMTRVPVKR